MYLCVYVYMLKRTPRAQQAEQKKGCGERKAQGERRELRRALNGYGERKVRGEHRVAKRSRAQGERRDGHRERKNRTRLKRRQDKSQEPDVIDQTPGRQTA